MKKKKMISEEQDSVVTQDIPAPDVNKINEMPEMTHQAVVQQPVAQQADVVQTQQPQQPQQNGQAPIQPIVETTTVQGQNIPATPEQNTVTVDTAK